MKTKFKSTVLIGAALFTITACGGSSDETSTETTDSSHVETAEGPDFNSICNNENDLTLSIQNYYFGGSGDEFNFTPANFSVLSSSWDMKNDSTGVLKLSNYTSDQIADGLKDEHAEIQVEFKTRNGNLLSAGEYKDGNFEAFSASTTITTNNGTTYFNWVTGMPEIGTVTINFVDSKNICGEINLSSDNKEVKYIGVVKLSGTFKI